jgi:hypothetical protein
MTQEITRHYRLDFRNDEPEWDDPIPPEITSRVLGRKATCTISRTSLLAWSLMSLPQVDVADLTSGGWIKIAISTDPHFDEAAFKAEVATVLASVRQLRSPERNSQPVSLAVRPNPARSPARVMLPMPGGSELSATRSLSLPG